MRLAISQINHEAQRRADGYAETVVQAGKLDGISCLISAEDLAAIRERFPLAKRSAPAVTIAAAVVATPPPPQPEAIPHHLWPKWALKLEQHRVAGEIGVGDTARRLAAKLGGEQYKALRMALGVPCRCAARQAEWNTSYPYLEASSDSPNRD